MRASLTTRDTITDSLQFWELGRVAYNIILAATVIGSVGPVAMLGFSFNNWAMLGVLAVFANILYCAAYPVDMFVQASHFRDEWRRGRWVLWVIGTAMAAWLTYGVFASLNFG